MSRSKCVIGGLSTGAFDEALQLLLLLSHLIGESFNGTNLPMYRHRRNIVFEDMSMCGYLSISILQSTYFKILATPATP